MNFLGAKMVPSEINSILDKLGLCYEILGKLPFLTVADEILLLV